MATDESWYDEMSAGVEVLETAADTLTHDGVLDRVVIHEYRDVLRDRALVAVSDERKT